MKTKPSTTALETYLETVRQKRTKHTLSQNALERMRAQYSVRQVG